MKKYYLPRSKEGKAAAFENLRDNIAPYVALFELDAADVTQQAKDATYYRAALGYSATLDGASSSWSGWTSTVLATGTGSEPATPAKPADFPATAVTPGILDRFTAMVNYIKHHKNYTPDIGKILGLEGSEDTGPDLDTVQPDFPVKISGNTVVIGWGWNGDGAFLDMIELQVDRGDGKGFGLLCYDTTPGYTDTTPLPATATTWTYRGIYRVGDKQVGQWSKPVKINVGG